MAKLISEDKEAELRALHAEKHGGAICVANYKGGVGKTTLVCLLGYYLAQRTAKPVLLIDIDAQCSLSLAVGFNPEKVTKTELTIYNLVRPSKWPRLRKTNCASYVSKVPDTSSPEGLYIIPGSLDVDELDMQISESLVREGERRKHEFFLYCKQMLNAFDAYDYILVDCPPNKMFLTQAMLRACSFYLPVTIPDAISVYGMPRLLRWVRQVPRGDKPLLLGYVLNAINRTGGVPGGKVYSQQGAERTLRSRIGLELDEVEREVLGDDPVVGVIPRLDAIARFLSEGDEKSSRDHFSRKTSGQPTINDCLVEITDKVLLRMEAYRAKA